MSEKQDEKVGNGPAFPATTRAEQLTYTNPGMSLRDYFAAHAPPMPPEYGHGMATWPWDYADMVLRQRDK